MRIRKILSRSIFDLNQKTVIISLRWLSVVFLACLILYPGNTGAVNLSGFYAVLFLYLLSNAILHFLKLNTFRKTNFTFTLFLFDILLLSFGIYFAQGFDQDLYLVFFLAIFMSILRQDMKSSLLIALISCLLYIAFFLKSQGPEHLISTNVLLRLPFFFLISMTGTYLSEQTRLEKEKTRMRLAEVERNVYMGESLSAIIQQLKNPIIALIGICQNMQKNEDPEKLKADANDATKRAFECLSFINKYLEFVHGHETGRIKTNINSIILNVLEFLRDQFLVDDIMIIDELHRELPVIDADPMLLKQAFMNIINNAYQAITSTQKPGQLTIRTDFNDRIIQVTIADTGAGISRSNLEKIFEPFFTTKEIGIGTGLGLSLAKDIIDRHNGKIFITSKEGKGTTVIIELPIKDK